jgi:hypothetical protein
VSGSPDGSATALTADPTATQTYTAGVSADGSTIVGGWKSATTHYISTWAIPANTRTDIYSTTSGTPTAIACSDDASVIIIADGSAVSWLVGGSRISAASSGAIAADAQVSFRVSTDNTKVFGASTDSGHSVSYLTTWNVSDGSIASSVLAALYQPGSTITLVKPSRDGTIFIGQATIGSLFAAYWKTSDGSITLLPQSSASYSVYEAWDISADNSLICGDGDDATPFVWQWNGSSYDLVLLPNDWQEYANQENVEFSQVLVISGDGTKLLGYSTKTAGHYPMTVWTQFGSAAYPNASIIPSEIEYVTETGSATDTVAASCVYSASITETGSASDTIDGSAVSFQRITLSEHVFNSAVNTTSITLPALPCNVGDVIIVIAHAAQTTVGPAISTLTATGLTFTQRTKVNGSAHGCDELWYAVVTTAGAYTITATYAAQFGGCCVCAFAFAGVNTSAPFSTYSGLPASQDYTSGTVSFTAGTTPGAYALTSIGGTSTITSSVPPTNFPTLSFATNGGGSILAGLTVAGVGTGPGGAGTFAWTGVPSTTSGEAIFDALAPASPWLSTNVESGTFLREVLNSPTGTLRSGAFVRELLNSPNGTLNSSALVREVLLGGGTGVNSGIRVDVSIREVLISGAVAPPASVGSASGSATATGHTAYTKTVTATAAGQGSATGHLTATNKQTVSATGSATVTGHAGYQIDIVATASGTSSATGRGAVSIFSIGSSNGMANALATGLEGGLGAGSATGASTVAATGVTGYVASGQAAGVASVVGVARGQAISAATAHGNATVAAESVHTDAAFAHALGQGSATGQSHVIAEQAALAAGVATALAIGSARASAGATATGAAIVTAHGLTAILTVGTASGIAHVLGGSSEGKLAAGHASGSAMANAVSFQPPVSAAEVSFETLAETPAPGIRVAKVAVDTISSDPTTQFAVGQMMFETLAEANAPVQASRVVAEAIVLANASFAVGQMATELLALDPNPSVLIGQTVRETVALDINPPVLVGENFAETLAISQNPPIEIAENYIETLADSVQPPIKLAEAYAETMALSSTVPVSAALTIREAIALAQAKIVTSQTIVEVIMKNTLAERIGAGANAGFMD